MRIAINGFGRIGKSFLRAFFTYKSRYKNIEIVALNSSFSDAQAIAYMYEYDTTMGAYEGIVTYTENTLVIDGIEIQLFSSLSPLQLPWQELRIDCVIEATGAFTHYEQAQQHVQAGARCVIITAPSLDEKVVTLVPGVTDCSFTTAAVFSLASCTTNAVMPLLKLLDDAFGIECAVMTTTHAYTNSQELLDVNAQKKDLRRSRAAACNIIPASTGAHAMLARLLPQLQDRVSLYSLRVPVPNISLIDLSCRLLQSCDQKKVHLLLQEASAKGYKGIIGLEYKELVSSDFYGNEHSVVVDMPLLSLEKNGMLKLFGWYDNEWGYSCRLLDVVQKNSVV